MSGSIQTPDTTERFTGWYALGLNGPVVMGILNVTPDSFSDGGRTVTVDSAVSRALRMVDEGAGIIDIGGESTRPGAEPVSEEEELSRVIPVVEALRAKSDTLISVDTYKAVVAKRALEAGADIINDISAGRMDNRMFRTVADSGAAYVMMHMQGTPRNMQDAPHYRDVFEEVYDFFRKRIDLCVQKGVDRGWIAIDPGFGFGKTLEHNLALMRQLPKFRALDRSMLIGVSRKSFIEKITGVKSAPDKRIGGSIAAALNAVARGASVVRAHDVRETVEALKVWRAIETGEYHGTV